MGNKVSRVKKRVAVIACILMILFITMGVREWSLSTGTVSLDLFRAIKNKNFSGLLFNIALFIPLGYLLQDAVRKKWLSFVLALLISLSVETLQYFTGRGEFDVDDLFFNTSGAAIGIIFWILLRNLIKAKPIIGRVVSVAMLGAGALGCLIAPRSSLPTNYTRQFDFHIDSVSVVNDLLNPPAMLGRTE